MSSDEVAILRNLWDLALSPGYPSTDLVGTYVGYCVDATPLPSYLRAEGNKSDSTEGYDQAFSITHFRPQAPCIFAAGTQPIYDAALLGLVQMVQWTAVAFGIYAVQSVSTQSGSRRIASETADGPSVDTSPSSSEPNAIIEKSILSDVVEAMSSLPAQETDAQGSPASDALWTIVQREGKVALRAIDAAILGGSIGHEATCETLVVLAQLQHPPTRDLRRLLLERYLFHRSGLIRDAAGIGLSIVDDPKSLTSLSLAVRREKNEVLRKDFEIIRAQLQRNR